MSIASSDSLAIQPLEGGVPATNEELYERANTITHALGLALSLPAVGYLLSRALASGDAWHIAGMVIYGLTMIGVYAASTASHFVNHAQWKHRCRQLDQAAIYLFIAGTFTPFAFNYVRDGFWLVIPIAVWGIALWGAFAKLFLQHRINGVELPVYVLLGWLPALSAPHVAGVCPIDALWWMIAGGLCYTAGVWFLKNDYRAWWLHSVWHLLVIAGTALHFVAVVLYVHPA